MHQYCISAKFICAAMFVTSINESLYSLGHFIHREKHFASTTNNSSCILVRHIGFAIFFTFKFRIVVSEPKNIKIPVFMQIERSYEFWPRFRDLGPLCGDRCIRPTHGPELFLAEVASRFNLKPFDHLGHDNSLRTYGIIELVPAQGPCHLTAGSLPKNFWHHGS